MRQDPGGLRTSQRPLSRRAFLRLAGAAAGGAVLAACAAPDDRPKAGTAGQIPLQ